MTPDRSVAPSRGRPARMIWVAALVCLFGAVMSTLLARAKLDEGLAGIVEARMTSHARELARSIERAQGIGLKLAELETLPALLARHRAADPLIRAIDVFDDGGRVVSSSDLARTGRVLPAEVRRAASDAGEAPWSAVSDEGRLAGLSLRTGFGLVIGHVGLRYTEDELERALAIAERRLYRAALRCFGLAALAAVALTLVIVRASAKPGAPPPWALAPACLLPLVVAMAAFGQAAHDAFAEQLLPQAERKAQVTGAGVAGLIERALAHGFELGRLRGVDAVLGELRAANPEIAYAAVVDGDGVLVYGAGPPASTGAPAGQVSIPLHGSGALVLGIDPEFVGDLLFDMAFDVGVVLLVALLLASELTRHVVGSRPGEAGRHLHRIRAPVFTFILAEELTRPCLPAYIGRLAADGAASAAPLVVGLPIAVFMLVVALGQPGLGRWSARVGRRPALFAGAATAAVGFAGSALAQGLWDLTAWRALGALGYALVFAAGQGYVLDHAGGEGRTRGFAVFVGAIMAATVCGPSIGGILADHLGQRATFAVSAVLCLLALLPMRALPRGRSSPPPTAARGEFRALIGLLANRRFAALVLLAAVPAKVLLIGGLFYLVPLYVGELGHGQAVAGRLIMLYGLLMVFLVPIFARHGDRGARRLALVVAGLCASGAGALSLASAPTLHGVVAMVALLGIGQALSISAQAALVGEVCGEEIARAGEDAVYGAYRLFERLGNVAGPLLAGALLTATEFGDSFAALGALAIACALALAVALSRMRGRETANARR